MASLASRRVLLRQSSRPVATTATIRSVRYASGSAGPQIPTRPLPNFEHDAPAPWQRAAQALGFVLSGVAGVYAVLFYDFEQESHCFQPIRARFENVKQRFFTISDREKQMLGLTQNPRVQAAQQPGNDTSDKLV